MNDPRIYDLVDPHAGISHLDIPVLSERAYSLYVRNHKRMTEGHYNIVGAIQMLKGLEYHFSNFERAHAIYTLFDAFRDTEKFIAHQQSSAFQLSREVLLHEVIAYLNRLGQFRKFLDSQFVKRFDVGFFPTKIVKILRLRDHWSAHRRIDDRQKVIPGEATLELSYLGAFKNKDGNVCFYYELSPGDFKEFVPITEHKIIINVVLEKLEACILANAAVSTEI